jgi:phosphoribosylformylglycinamidine cyclo-ligase|tara:strand:- start:29058 stop:30212 length:1155 start_codon:yes stop_codon:yes gene_type:complete
LSRYEKRGVSSQKEDVHKAITNVDKGIFPNAFCKIVEDYIGGDSKYCNIVHADGAGTKSSLAYLYWKETGDISVWRGVAQDALVMNLDDIICTGSIGPFLLSNTIGRNKHLIPGAVIKEIIDGFEECIETMSSFGTQIKFTGGETADVGDLVKTIIVDSTVACRPKRDEILEVNIQPTDVIVGFASYGQATYESSYNAGMGSNGLTSGRHDLLHHAYYAKYPESFDKNTDEEYIYSGQFSLTDPLEGTPVDIGKALLSPTRTYAPILNKIVSDTELKKGINGIIHCTGGAQTKVMKFLDKPLHIIKDDLLPIPPLFDTIQKTTGTEMKEMFEVFNMGHRLEIYCDKDKAQELIDIAATFNVEAKIIGRCEPSDKKELTINGIQY